MASDESSCIHFLTGTPDPSVSIYKPFRFGIGDDLDATTSPCSFPMQAQVTHSLIRKNDTHLIRQNYTNSTMQHARQLF